MSELLKPRTATVVIYQGDDLETLGDLRREVDRAERRVEEQRRSGAPRRDGDEIPNTQPQRDAYDAFVEEAAGRAVTVTLRALGRRRFRDLVADHPPRTSTDEDGTETTHHEDAGYEVNADTFPMALLTFVDGDVRTITEPEFSTSAALRDFLDDVISEGDFTSLWTTAYFLNRSPGADPKVSRYSTTSLSSDATST